jgi:predicted RNase H-like HicB family nuclease
MPTDVEIDAEEYPALEDAVVTVRVENGLYIADDEVTGVSSQGPSEEAALANLAETVATYTDGQSDHTGDSWL